MPPKVGRGMQGRPSANRGGGGGYAPQIPAGGLHNFHQHNYVPNYPNGGGMMNDGRPHPNAMANNMYGGPPPPGVGGGAWSPPTPNRFDASHNNNNLLPSPTSGNFNSSVPTALPPMQRGGSEQMFNSGGEMPVNRDYSAVPSQAGAMMQPAGYSQGLSPVQHMRQGGGGPRAPPPPPPPQSYYPSNSQSPMPMNYNQLSARGSAPPPPQLDATPTYGRHAMLDGPLFTPDVNSSPPPQGYGGASVMPSPGGAYGHQVNSASPGFGPNYRGPSLGPPMQQQAPPPAPQGMMLNPAVSNGGKPGGYNVDPRGPGGGGGGGMYQRPPAAHPASVKQMLPSPSAARGPAPPAPGGNATEWPGASSYPPPMQGVPFPQGAASSPGPGAAAPGMMMSLQVPLQGSTMPLPRPSSVVVGENASSPPPPQQQQQPLYPESMGGLTTTLPYNNTAPETTALEADDEMAAHFYNLLKDKSLLRGGLITDLFPPNRSPKDDPVSMAIDGNHLLENLCERLRNKDPFWLLHSLLPDGLLRLIRQSVERMRERNIEPIWVFNGIGINGDVEAFLPDEEELALRTSVWRILTDGELPSKEMMTRAFETSSGVGEDVIMAVQRYLRNELGVLAVTAPFLNWCQMATYHKEGDVSLLMGPSEMLMVSYEPMKVIVEVDFDTFEVAYFDRDQVLRTLFPNYVRGNSTAAAGDRLLDLGLLISSHMSIVSGHAELGMSPLAIYEELASARPRFSSLHNFISNAEFSNPSGTTRRGSEVLKHARGRAYIQYSAVFSQKHADSPLVYFKRVLNPSLTNANMPHNLSGILGNLVPMCLFYFQYVGLLSSSLMTIITQSYFRDAYPVADTRECHEHLSTLADLRGQIVYQIVLKMNNSTAKQRLEKISWVRWYDNILYAIRCPREVICLDEWVFPKEQDLSKLDDAEMKESGIALMLSMSTGMESFPSPESAEHTGRDSTILYRGRQQTFFAILLKAFDFLGYFSHSAEEGSCMEVMETFPGGANGELKPGQQHEQHPYQLHELLPEAAAQPEQLPADAELNPFDNADDAPMAAGGGAIFFTMNLGRALECCPTSFHAALVRFTEFLRVGIINSSPCEYFSLENEIATLDDSDLPSEVVLASRIACLISIPYEQSSTEKLEWAPVYCRHLCAFSVVARTMSQDLRELMEVITASVFLSGYSDCDLDTFTSFIPLLPLGDMPSSIGGLLLHYVLVFPADYEKMCNTREQRIQHLQEKFKYIPDLAVHLRTVLQFTFEALFLLNAYRHFDKAAVKAKILLTSSVIDDTIRLLYEKWDLHIADPPPVDIHGLWS